FSLVGAALNLQLSLLEARILGVLVEKELTVSDIYPLSLNALTAGCNQKNNRNPVLNTSELDVQAAIDRLKPLSLVIESSGSRVMRYSQNIGRVLKVPSEAVALLAALWLRGAQTAAELRAATERLHRFADVSSVEGFLTQLAERSLELGGPLVRLLPRAVGAREPRWVDLLSPAAESVNMVATREPEVGTVPAPDWRDEVEQLRSELQALRERVQQLENRGPLG
ncbi:MAG: YceH family protein, partial [Aeromicrobium sp.]